MLVLLDPRQAYAGLAAHPRSLGMMLLTPAMSASALVVFVATEMGRSTMLRSTTTLLQAIGAPSGTIVHGIVYGAVAETPLAVGLVPWILMPLGTLGTAWLLRAIFRGRFSGRVTFEQTLAVVAHASLILAIGVVFTVALGLTRGEPALVRLPSMLVQTAPVALIPVLRALDPFVLWWALNLATGLGVLYRRGPTLIGVLLAAVYFGMLAVLAPWVPDVDGASPLCHTEPAALRDDRMKEC